MERGALSASRVVILGGGFGGLSCAQALRGAPVRVTLVDRRNHHVFQPLLYQVATAALSPAQIAAPIRKVLRKQRNAEVLLAEARRIDLDRREVELEEADGGANRVPYDWLVVATGATHSYFGREEWERFAPGLKTIEEALEIRRRFLLAFEAAECAESAERRRALLTFVVVGGGPTGVELAGAIAEISRSVIRRDFRRIDTTTTRVILVEALERLLPSGFPPALSARALRDLRALGVEVLLDTRVTAIDAEGVIAGDRRIGSENVIWAAGVRASPLGAALGAGTDGAGRVPLAPDLSVPGRPEVFVVGDLAKVVNARTGVPVPGMAPGAMQMGRHVARVIAAEARGAARTSRAAFVYRDQGVLATIGRARAVALVRGVPMSGMAAWLFWALVHVFYLIGFRNRVAVMLDWAWDYLFFERGARLITGAAITRAAGTRSDRASPP